MTAEYFKNLFKAKALNAYTCSIQRDGNARYQYYGNSDLNKLSREAFENGQDVFYAKHIKPESERFADRYELDDPHYVYHLKRDLTEEEYNALIALLD